MFFFFLAFSVSESRSWYKPAAGGPDWANFLTYFGQFLKIKEAKNIWDTFFCGKCSNHRHLKLEQVCLHWSSKKIFLGEKHLVKN
jgi:hypothetical protein